MSGVTVDRFDPSTASEGDLRAVFELNKALDVEVEEEGPAPVWEEWSYRVRNRPSWRPLLHWVAHEGGELVATASAELDDSGTNRSLAEIFGGVVPDRRRRGIATALYDMIRDDLVADGRTLLAFHTRDGAAPAEAFIARTGATKRIVERRSRCPVAGLDRALLEGWVQRAAERARDYDLVDFSLPTPEELVERWADLQFVMNTAPLDDFEFEDERLTPAMIREIEGRMADLGRSNRVLVARHEASDDWAGFSELIFTPHHPMMAIQEGTGVRPEHRDRGLGRWVKAANALWLVDNKPDVEYIDTWNAFSNAPMLAINDAMGFEVVGAYAAWQVQLN